MTCGRVPAKQCSDAFLLVLSVEGGGGGPDVMHAVLVSHGQVVECKDWALGGLLRLDIGSHVSGARYQRPGTSAPVPVGAKHVVGLGHGRKIIPTRQPPVNFTSMELCAYVCTYIDGATCVLTYRDI